MRLATEEFDAMTLVNNMRTTNGLTTEQMDEPAIGGMTGPVRLHDSGARDGPAGSRRTVACLNRRSDARAFESRLS